MLRVLLWVTLLFLSTAVRAEGYIARMLNKPVPGGVAVVQLGQAQQAPVVHFGDRRVMVLREATGEWIAVVGIGLETPANSKQRIDVEQDGARRGLSFQVGSKQYVAQHITVKNPQHVSPDTKNLKRIENELAEQKAAYRQFSPGLPSNVMLDRPVPGRLSSPFGLRRFFNGEPRNPHSGLDFAAATGTPIKAPAAGKVILVGDFFFNGKTVFVDHGQGFISMFCHLSKIDVKVGQTLERGQVLGQVGATGRATGPHLHWNVSLNDARVDPAIFIGAFKP
ncbi:M23 family metallopeptidase [Pusillimonas sp. CC-YST705]|uniref:M23 family metallopeptidase n=1 Tax=Mesopusillimonas faecipullorum TaxID=2755040 RepID=A0ABS8CE00_9BURK|nr:peptidoglycan DD-metalloendopeptidase family protein [Mesopusillimonas faecipullorum]MCB5364228.1 M23 family metallopeptidase [Mesopusillimonas faecipullorum]